jgi:hypothetical protein
MCVVCDGPVRQLHDHAEGDVQAWGTFIRGNDEPRRRQFDHVPEADELIIAGHDPTPGRTTSESVQPPRPGRSPRGCHSEVDLPAGGFDDR